MLTLYPLAWHKTESTVETGATIAPDRQSLFSHNHFQNIRLSILAASVDRVVNTPGGVLYKSDILVEKLIEKRSG